MSIYTIGDLHLSFKENKPMDIFGENWNNHDKKIANDWKRKVKDDDLVVLPGDFSWAMYLKDTDEDFRYINSLPGKKLLLKGNHDYWWNTLAKMRKFILEQGFENIDFIYNNAYKFEDYVIVGTRGWTQNEDDESKKIFRREAIRLELSIQDGIKKYGNNLENIAFTHYPPINEYNVIENKTNQIIDILQKYNIKKCYYGHLHSTAINDAIEGNYFGIEFKLVSADGVDFKLQKVK